MKVLGNRFFRAGLGALFTLILLRLIWSNPVSSPNIFWALSFAWPFLVASALAYEQGVSVSQGSPWSALVVITSLIVSLLTMIALGLPMDEVQMDAFLVGFFGFVSVVLCIGWWRMMRPKKPHASEARARPWLYLALGVVTAIAVAVDKFDLIR
ncbi:MULTISPECIES: hypothetical protein [Stenotrophomonas]|uniref:hypothetical protein n=1 Tax=Stenotrophomonas TaxID=40323 RepID=UPI0008733CB8|nr:MULTISPECIES: hypothetical protein [Stenotrophomonas]OEZ00918.1 hypothetical protein BIY45_09260 [Stenotrophomonas sp. BIIR7]